MHHNHPATHATRFHLEKYWVLAVLDHLVQKVWIDHLVTHFRMGKTRISMPFCEYTQFDRLMYAHTCALAYGLDAHLRCRGPLADKQGEECMYPRFRGNVACSVSDLVLDV